VVVIKYYKNNNFLIYFLRLLILLINMIYQRILKILMFFIKIFINLNKFEIFYKKNKIRWYW